MREGSFFYGYINTPSSHQFLTNERHHNKANDGRITHFFLFFDVKNTMAKIYVFLIYEWNQQKNIHPFAENIKYMILEDAHQSRPYYLRERIVCFRSSSAIRARGPVVRLRVGCFVIRALNL